MRFVRWNWDKKHRCPTCHAVYTTGDVSRWATYECCSCNTYFGCFPWLWRVLPFKGVVCNYKDPRHKGTQPK